MAFRFEDLLIWQKGMELNDRIDQLSKSFPKDELYILTSHLKRASDSVVLNVAEGAAGQTKPVFKTFLNYALRPAFEVVNCLIIAQRRQYIDQTKFEKLYSEHEQLVKMITALRNPLDKTP